LLVRGIRVACEEHMHRHGWQHHGEDLEKGIPSGGAHAPFPNLFTCGAVENFSYLEIQIN
jgi:hypothetical protein